MSEKKDSKFTVDRLLELEAIQPERKLVEIPRLLRSERLRELGRITLQELSYDKVMKCRQRPDPKIYYLMESIAVPDIRAESWYKEKMGCATPADALKKALRAGEIERLCIQADSLNGYAPGSVVAVEAPEEALEGAAIAGALEDLEKN